MGVQRALSSQLYLDPILVWGQVRRREGQKGGGGTNFSIFFQKHIYFFIFWLKSFRNKLFQLINLKNLKNNKLDLWVGHDQKILGQKMDKSKVVRNCLDCREI